MQAIKSAANQQSEEIVCRVGNTAHGGLLSGVREKEIEGGSSGTTRVNAHAELLSPSHRPKFNGPISGPSRRGMGTRGSICASWQLNPPVQLRKR